VLGDDNSCNKKRKYRQTDRQTNIQTENPTNELWVLNKIAFNVYGYKINYVIIGKPRECKQLHSERLT